MNFLGSENGVFSLQPGKPLLPKRGPKWSKKCQKWSKTPKMVQNGPKWSKSPKKGPKPRFLENRLSEKRKNRTGFGGRFLRFFTFCVFSKVPTFGMFFRPFLPLNTTLLVFLPPLKFRTKSFSTFNRPEKGFRTSF